MVESAAIRTFHLDILDTVWTYTKRVSAKIVYNRCSTIVELATCELSLRRTLELTLGRWHLW
jgi:hypothetical protein